MDLQVKTAAPFDNAPAGNERSHHLMVYSAFRLPAKYHHVDSTSTIVRHVTKLDRQSAWGMILTLKHTAHLFSAGVRFEDLHMNFGGAVRECFGLIAIVRYESNPYGAT